MWTNVCLAINWIRLGLVLPQRLNQANQKITSAKVLPSSGWPPAAQPAAKDKHSWYLSLRRTMTGHPTTYSTPRPKDFCLPISGHPKSVARAKSSPTGLRSFWCLQSAGVEHPLDKWTRTIKPSSIPQFNAAHRFWTPSWGKTSMEGPGWKVPGCSEFIWKQWGLIHHIREAEKPSLRWQQLHWLIKCWSFSSSMNAASCDLSWPASPRLHGIVLATLATHVFDTAQRLNVGCNSQLLLGCTKYWKVRHITEWYSKIKNTVGRLGPSEYKRSGVNQ